MANFAYLVYIWHPIVMPRWNFVNVFGIGKLQ